MATIAQMRAGLTTRLATISGLTTAAYMPDTPNVPGAYVGPAIVDYDETFNNEATYTFTVTVVVSRADETQGQTDLDPYLEPTGSSSIPAAINADFTLAGLVDSTRVIRATPGFKDFAGIDYFAAELEVQIFG
jgi:hypothetical protein